MIKAIQSSVHGPAVRRRPRLVWLAAAVAGLLAMSSASYGLGKISSYAFVRDSEPLSLFGRAW